MPRRLTAEELHRKLSNLSEKSIPAIEEGMTKAALNVEGVAKKYCTPGSESATGYWHAPYSDDTDKSREGSHMRDVMYYKIETDDRSIHGVVGNPKSYALYVHEGTSRMRARPFILDAIQDEDTKTRTLLSKAIYDMLKTECS